MKNLEKENMRSLREKKEKEKSEKEEDIRIREN